MGVPQDMHEQVFNWSNRLIGFSDPEYSTSQEDAQQAAMEMFMYANTLAIDRKANPRDDLVSVLINAEVEGERLTEADFDGFFLLLAVAGNETTRNAISHGMNAFLDNPEQWELWKRERPATMVDEVVRWATPVSVFQRTALADVPAAERADTAVVFTAHSIPTAMAVAAPYVDEFTAAARAVAGRAGCARWSLAYQSRSGRPGEPWLEPDIGDAVRGLAADGVRRAVVMPLGFVCDHVEVLYDLDVEARALAVRSGLGFHRAAAVNDHPEFVAMLAELVVGVCG